MYFYYLRESFSAFKVYAAVIHTVCCHTRGQTHSRMRLYVEVMQRVRGIKLLSVLNRARERRKRPVCPAVAAARHADGGIGWDGVFGTMFKAWGVMLLRHGHYHSDPHPGNFMLAKDGRLAILDWGQTQVAPDSYRLHVCRLVLAMVAEDYPRVADEAGGGVNDEAKRQHKD